MLNAIKHLHWSPHKVCTVHCLCVHNELFVFLFASSPFVLGICVSKYDYLLLDLCSLCSFFICLIRTLLDMNFDIIVGIIIIFVFDTLFDACIFILNSNIRCHSLNGQLYQTAHMSCMHETSPSWLHSMLAPIGYGKWWLSVIPA